MLDFLKRKLEIGDHVVLMHPFHKCLLLARETSKTTLKSKLMTPLRMWITLLIS